MFAKIVKFLDEHANDTYCMDIIWKGDGPGVHLGLCMRECLRGNDRVGIVAETCHFMSAYDTSYTFYAATPKKDDWCSHRAPKNTVDRVPL